jgi:hypothetical protein
MNFKRSQIPASLRAFLPKKSRSKERKTHYSESQRKLIFRGTLEGRWLSRWERISAGTEFTAPIQQYEAIPDRKFRYDFAFPDLRILVEVQGGICARTRMGHSSVTGQERDAEKLNLASAYGYRMFHFTTKMIEDERGFDLLLNTIKKMI